MNPTPAFAFLEPLRDEKVLRSQVEALPESHVAEAATSVLALVIDRTAESLDLEHQSTDLDSPGRLNTAVVIGAAVRAYRAARAGIAVVSSGYELEADAMTRIVIELYVQARAIVDDSSGREARKWIGLERKWGIGKRIKSATDSNIYESLSVAAHGDPRGLRHLLDPVTAGSEGPVVQWGPRLTGRHKVVLTALSLGARDMTVLLEESSGQTHRELELIDQGLQKLVPDWSPHPDRRAP